MTFKRTLKVSLFTATMIGIFSTLSLSKPFQEFVKYLDPSPTPPTPQTEKVTIPSEKEAVIKDTPTCGGRQFTQKSNGIKVGYHRCY